MVTESVMQKMTVIRSMTEDRQLTAAARGPLALAITSAMFVFAGIVFAGAAAADEPGYTVPSSASQPIQWRLIWTDDPATTAKISWSTQAATKKNVVYLSAADGTSRVVEAKKNGPYTSSKGSLHYHHAKVYGLEPGTRYEVTIESDSVRSPDFWFKTASTDDTPVRFLFGGDSRSDPAARRQVNRLIAQLAERDPSIVCFAHGGDYINTGSSFAQWNQWMSDHEMTTLGSDDGRRLLPIVPARGNHDMGPLFNEVFGYSLDDGNYFAINIAPQVRLITLNTEISAGFPCLKSTTSIWYAKRTGIA